MEEVSRQRAASSLNRRPHLKKPTWRQLVRVNTQSNIYSRDSPKISGKKNERPQTRPRAGSLMRIKSSGSLLNQGLSRADLSMTLPHPRSKLWKQRSAMDLIRNPRLTRAPRRGDLKLNRRAPNNDKDSVNEDEDSNKQRLS